MRDLHALILAVLPVGRTKTSRWAIAAITLGLFSAYGLSVEPAHAQSIPVLPPVTPENVDVEDSLQNEADEAGDTILEELDTSEPNSDVEPASSEEGNTELDDEVGEDDSSIDADINSGDASPEEEDTSDVSPDEPVINEPTIDEPSATDEETVILDSDEGDRPDADDLLLDEGSITPDISDSEELSGDEIPENTPPESDTEGLDPELDSELNPDIFELEIEVNDPNDIVPEIAPSVAPPPTTPAAPSSSFKPSRGATIFENVVLAPNTMVNPTTIRGISGGPLTASRVAGRTDTATGICTGFVDRQPDHRIELTEFFDYLSLQVESPEDTVLVVRGPGGSWCNDDVLGFNPGLAGEWFSGTYDVWVGSYNEETYHPYIIRLTDDQ